MADTNYDGKHLTTTQRIKIEKGLLESEALASIAGNLFIRSSTQQCQIAGQLIHLFIRTI